MRIQRLLYVVWTERSDAVGFSMSFAGLGAHVSTATVDGIGTSGNMDAIYIRTQHCSAYGGAYLLCVLLCPGVWLLLLPCWAAWVVHSPTASAA